MNGFANLIIPSIISAGAGLVGVGVGIGLFKGTVKQIQKDIAIIQTKQRKLRGEDNGSIPIYMSRAGCILSRDDCLTAAALKLHVVNNDIKEHAKSINALSNFARWWMQKEGLKIEEINTILDR